MGRSPLRDISPGSMSIEESESPQCRLHMMAYTGGGNVTVPPVLGLNAITVTSGSEPVCLSSMMDEPKALSSLPKETTKGVSLRGVQIKEPSGDGGRECR